MSISGAINIFLRQCLLCDGLPFNVELHNQETQKAVEEARRITADPSAQGYQNLQDLENALNDN